MSVSYCDLNPMTRNYLASPVAVDSFKILCLRMLLVIVNSMMSELPRVQVIIMLLCVWFIMYYVCDSAIYQSNVLNCLTCGMWFSMLYTMLLLTALTFSENWADPQYAFSMTMNVLYGVFPIYLAGMAVGY
eukprot:jgi/Chrzof1/12273/Cz06g28080.t1